MDDQVLIGQQLLQKAIDFGANFGPKILGALLTLIIGLWLINRVSNLVKNKLTFAKTDVTLSTFISNLINIGLKVLLVISVAGIVGIQTTSFIAVIGAAGLAIGMALQGSLGNFAGGVLILIFRPFKVGSYIKAQGHEGNVKEILMFVTVLKTLDNQIVYLPNGPLAGGAIQNLNAEELRRVDMVFGISYGANIDHAREAFKSALNQIDEVLKDPAPDIIVTALADSSVNFSIRPWCKAEHYWVVYAKAHEAIKKTLDKENIAIPFPQRDVHIFQSK